MKKMIPWLLTASTVFLILSCTIVRLHEVMKFFAIILSFGPTLFCIIMKMEKGYEAKKYTIFAVVNVVLFITSVSFIAVYNAEYPQYMKLIGAGVFSYNLVSLMVFEIIRTE